MANEKVIKAPDGPNDSEQDFAVQLLSGGTEQVNAVVGTNDIAIIIGSAVLLNSGELGEAIKKLSDNWREREYATS